MNFSQIVHLHAANFVDCCFSHLSLWYCCGNVVNLTSGVFCDEFDGILHTINVNNIIWHWLHA